MAFGCLGLKTGAVGGERVAKLNELMRIEELAEGPEAEASAGQGERRPSPKRKR